MGIVAKDNGGDMEPIPAGMHRAIHLNTFDVGWQPGYQGGPAAHKVIMLWEIEPRNEQGKRFTVTKIYTLSINKKSNLGMDLESWRSVPFTEAELDGFDLDRVKGKPCQLNLVQNGDRVKVANVLPPMKKEGTDGKMHIVEHWTPETPETYVPKFVDKMREQAIPEPARKTRETRIEERVGADGFVDEIPFDQGSRIVARDTGADALARWATETIYETEIF